MFDTMGARLSQGDDMDLEWNFDGYGSWTLGVRLFGMWPSLGG